MIGFIFAAIVGGICGIGFWVLIIWGIIKYFEVWTTRNYVNDFGKPTGDKYLIQKNEHYGIFSNSTTTNSSMTYYTYIDKDDVSFKFWDYGKYQLKNTNAETASLDFKCLTPTGERMETELLIGGYSSNISFAYTDDAIEFINLLKGNKSIDCIVTSGNLKYKFTIKSSNFKKLYEKTFNNN